MIPRNSHAWIQIPAIVVALATQPIIANPVLTPGVWKNIGTPETFGVAGGQPVSGSYGINKIAFDQRHPNTIWVCAERNQQPYLCGQSVLHQNGRALHGRGA